MRFSLTAASSALLLLQHLQPTVQVDINLAWMHLHQDQRDPVLARCTDIPPGHCCKPNEEILLQGGETLFTYRWSDFSVSPLGINQFAAGFAATTAFYDGIKCSDIPIARIFGPTALHASFTAPPRWSQPHPMNLVFAASWVDLRTKVPPTSPDIKYLEVQGVRRLAWGFSRWDQWLAGGPGHPPWKRKRDGGRRLNSFARPGTAYIQAPTRWRYADTYTINRTEYRAAGNGTFRSDDGRLLQLR